MVIRTKPLPQNGEALGPFAVHYVEQLDAHPADYHVGTQRVDRLKLATENFNQKLAAQLAAVDAAKAATREKDEAQTQLLHELGSCSRFVKGNDEVSDASLERLGLPPRSTHRTPVRRPTSFPLVDVMSTACVEHTLTIINPDSKTRRGKPHGVTGCEIYVAVSTTVPTAEADYRLVNVATRGTEVVTFNNEEGGKPAHYRVRWVNTRGEVGPFSPVFSATIPAV